MSTITTLQNTDTGSASLGVINTNFNNLNTDKIEATQTVALTNKTIDGDLNTVQDLPYSAIKSTSRSGLDVTVITGTKGSTNELGKFNADGDLISAGMSTTTTTPTSASLDTTIPTSLAVYNAIQTELSQKHFFVPVTGGNTVTSAYDTVVGHFVTNTPDNAQNLYFNFKIPDNYTALTEAVIVMIPDTTEIVQYDLNSNYGQVGELHTIGAESVLDATSSATINVLLECSAAGVLVGVTAGDYVGLRINSNTTTLQIIGLAIKYT